MDVVVRGSAAHVCITIVTGYFRHRLPEPRRSLVSPRSLGSHGEIILGDSPRLFNRSLPGRMSRISDVRRRPDAAIGSLSVVSRRGTGRSLIWWMNSWWSVRWSWSQAPGRRCPLSRTRPHAACRSPPLTVQPVSAPVNPPVADRPARRNRPAVPNATGRAGLACASR